LGDVDGKIRGFELIIIINAGKVGLVGGRVAFIGARPGEGRKDDKKDLLTTRLSSFDVSGLGISPLAGSTLVQYSGSLTGHDF